MKKKKLEFLSLVIAVILTTAGLAGCTAESGTEAAAHASGVIGIDVEYSSQDIDAVWDPETATHIVLDEGGIAISGDGADSEANAVTISDAGTYVLSGALADGRIIIDAAEDDTVRIVLDSCEINCSDNAAIYAKQAGKTILTLADGTSNTISDGEAYVLAEGEDEPDAAIFSQDDLTINGSGTLTVIGNYNNGIGSKDDLVITGGDITVTAVNDGLRGRDSIAILSGAFTIDAGGDGLQSNNDEDTARGWISIDGGSFNITARNDAIQAETILQATDGSLVLNTGGGSAKTASDASDEDASTSAKGLKSGSGLLIAGGVIDIDSSDDAIHTNGNLWIDSGEITIASRDDGIHADSAVTISGGTIDIEKCYEGLEGASITVTGGTIDLTADDDGFNAAGGSDGSSREDSHKENSFSADESLFIRISGGDISIDATGDGIDSNGSLYFEGGTVLVSGPTNSGNGPMDYNGTCTVTGGLLAIAGSSGMAQAPSDSSSQNTLVVYYTQVQAAGTLASLLDSNGNPIVSYAPAKEYQCILFSSPDLATGQTYKIASGGTNSGAMSDGSYTGGSVTGSTILTDVTISASVIKISDTGAAVTGGSVGPGGMKGGGGGQGPEGAANGAVPPTNGGKQPHPEDQGGKLRPGDN